MITSRPRYPVRISNAASELSVDYLDIGYLKKDKQILQNYTKDKILLNLIFIYRPKLRNEPTCMMA